MGFDVLGVGNPFRDRTAFIKEELLGEQSLEKGTLKATPELDEVNASWEAAGQADVDSHMGGSCTNVIKTLARLGTSCALHGKIGQGEVGDWIKERLSAIGVHALLSETETPTGTINCYITPDAERTLYGYFGASSELTEGDLERMKEKFSIPKHVHAEGYLAYFGDVLKKSLALAKEQRKTTSLDLGDRNVVKDFSAKFAECTKKVDLLFGNISEMRELTGKEEISEIMSTFSPSQTVVITEGKHGCWVKERGREAIVHFEARSVNPVDVASTTGAGDFFAGGFLHGFVQNQPIGICAKLGHLAASYVIQEVPADLPEEKWAELKNEIQGLLLEKAS